ncbi:MAG: type I DNA topoisomerase [Elusimicrobia bacterium]|nr:type I DNA topoisomerase [Elusimicrobiota bacterium]
MKRALVIVESPTKERTIAKFLGKDYLLKSTYGHIRDLPKRSLGVDEDHHFEPEYVLLPKAKKVVAALRAAVKGSDRVYLATDFDREGEAIAWHVVQALNLSEHRVARITFHEITPSAIKEAVAHPRALDMHLVHAQQARRVLDRLVGYKLSPLLWNKIKKGLSAGRVQSVALRLIVEREQEIKAFQPQVFWRIEAELSPEGAATPILAELTQYHGERLESTRSFTLFADEYQVRVTTLVTQAQAEAVIAELKGCHYRVAQVLPKETHRSPAPPFVTASLQQEAARRLGFSAMRTMIIAQQLYEGVELRPEGSVGLITYMRTDSVNVAASAQAEARAWIERTYGRPYLPSAPRTYRTKTKGAQEAHEAIRPTSVSRVPEALKPHLSAEQGKLYELIWRRFVASQMAEAVYDTVSVEIHAAPRFPAASPTGVFRVSGRTLKFPGFLAVYRDEGDRQEQDHLLPALHPNQPLDLRRLIPGEHISEPPPRYNEASLIRMLERHGIGRPSTYAPILHTILQRGYIRQEERKLFPTELGGVVTGLLKGYFQEIVDIQFTAQIEAKLDEIARGRMVWTKVVEGFYTPFGRTLAQAATKIPQMRITPKDSGERCTRCGAPMLIRESRFGRFLSCANYPRCSFKISLDKDGRKILPEVTTERCEKCGKPMLKRVGRRGPFLACSGYPSCRNIIALDREGRKIPKPAPQMTDQRCDKCGKPMVLRVGRRGPFLACSGFPRCRYIQKAA